jgi:hypothetical protein
VARMTRRLAAGLALTGSLILLAGCKSDDSGVVAEPGWVTGRATDADGRPIAGVEVTVTYQSYGGGRAMRYGASYSQTEVTDARGIYRIRIGNQALGEYSASASRPARAGDAGMRVQLVPENQALFAQNAATIRNFRLIFVEQTPDNPYGNGGIFVVENAIGSYASLENAEVTLQAVAGGRPIVRRVRRTGEGWVVTGLAPGQYRASVTLDGRPLLMNASGMDARLDAYTTSLVGSFNGGASGRVFRVRVKPQ